MTVTTIKGATVYTEYMIEYDADNLVVYFSGLTPDGYWDELACHEDVNNPEEFAEGYAARLRDDKKVVSIEKVLPF